ncbi:hypothetical protein BKA69DRAFT_1121517 [Paraphysoderma sedebokerense]|nr:hypothetical protein BKA69DRAFT_1121517 [Paraphysoderma sedebokerense]
MMSKVAIVLGLAAIASAAPGMQSPPSSPAAPEYNAPHKPAVPEYESPKKHTPSKYTPSKPAATPCPEEDTPKKVYAPKQPQHPVESPKKYVPSKPVYKKPEATPCEEDVKTTQPAHTPTEDDKETPCEDEASTTVAVPTESPCETEAATVPETTQPADYRNPYDDNKDDKSGYLQQQSSASTFSISAVSGLGFVVAALVLITTLEGSLLAFSGSSERSARIFAAISSNIWNIYEKNGKGISQNGVNQLMINCENGKLLSMRLSKKLVLCIVGNDDVEFGLLKSKAVSLKSALEEPMKQIMESS